MNLLFNSDIVKLQLKVNVRRHRRPNFVIFIVWSTLIVGEWVQVDWSRKSCIEPAEIPSFVFQVLFNDGERRVIPRFYFLISDVNQGNKDVGWVQYFLFLSQGWTDSQQIFHELLKIENMLWKCGLEFCGICSCRMI